MPRLKSWESPRCQGRNDKGKVASARKRQLKKRQQMLRNQLKAKGEEKIISSFFCFIPIFHVKPANKQFKIVSYLLQ